MNSQGGFCVVGNIFVVGLDDRNEVILHRLPDASDCAFHKLLGLDALWAFPRTSISIVMSEGDRQAHSIGEDSYNCVLAEIFTGGDTDAALQRVYDASVAELGFDIDPVPVNAV